MLIGEDLWKYLEEKGVTRHEHTNGLMSCYWCTRIVVSGLTKKELEQEDNESMKQLAKEAGIEWPIV